MTPARSSGDGLAMITLGFVVMLAAALGPAAILVAAPARRRFLR